MIVVHSTHPGWLSNAYLIAPGEGGDAIVVDSGAPLGPIFASIRAQRLRLRAVLATHRHPDHVAGLPELRARTGAPILALEGESEFIEGSEPIPDGNDLTWDGLSVRAVHLPGHTPRQAGYLVRGVGLFCGDCVFAGSVGSTNRSGSHGFAAARTALLDRILGFPDGTVLFPGHGGATTVGRERRTNPFLRVLTGIDPEGTGPCRVGGREARLIVLAREHGGHTKAWVRFERDEADTILPGNEVEIHRAVSRPPPRAKAPDPGADLRLPEVARD